MEHYKLLMLPDY